MNTLLQDFRYAIRAFLRTPGVTIAAIATVALGIGANAAIFSVIQNVLIAPFPYPAADRLAIAWRQHQSLGDALLSPSTAEAARWKDVPSIEDLVTFRNAELVLAGENQPLTLRGVEVSVNLLDFTGTAPMLGRPFNAGDASSVAGAKVVILTEALWRTRFGRDPSVVGTTVELSDQRYQIIGVIPSSLRLPMTRGIDLLLPLSPDPPAGAGAKPQRRPVSVVTRLKPGASLAATEQEMTAAGVDGIGGQAGWGAKLMPPTQLTGDTLRQALLVLLGAVGCVLLIGCANVANLLLARNAGRAREFGVRIALGASPGRLARQLLTENLLLATAGGLAGLAVAMWAVDGISAVAPPQLEQLANVRISREVFAVSMVLSLVTGLLFGLLPALSARRLELADTLKQGTRAAGGAGGSRTRRVLTIAEVALAVVLLAGAGLLLRSYASVIAEDPGFRTEGLLTAVVDLPASRYADPRTQVDFTTRFVERVRALPGVSRAVLATGVPPKDGMIFGQLEIEGAPGGPTDAPSMFGGGFVEPGFFEALGMTLQDGRLFNDTDIGTRNVIVNASTVQRHWPGESPIGKRLRLNARDTWSTVVGVVNDIRSDHGRIAGVQLYLPLNSPATGMGVTVLVAVTEPPRAMIDAIRAQAWAIDPKLPLDDIQTLEAALAAGFARPRFNVILLSIFAALGLLLAAVGVYGVISHSVGLRTQEIGVRMALGARASDIRAGVLREAMWLGSIGAAIGIAGALLLGRTMSRLLFGVSPADVPTLITVALVLIATSMLAAWLPARRAMRVDPMIALRAE